MSANRDLPHCFAVRACPAVARSARPTQIALNSFRHLHCPKCQGAAAREWLAAREPAAPVPYFTWCSRAGGHLRHSLVRTNRDLLYSVHYIAETLRSRHLWPFPRTSAFTRRRPIRPALLGLGAHTSSACAPEIVPAADSSSTPQWVVPAGLFLPCASLAPVPPACSSTSSSPAQSSLDSCRFFAKACPLPTLQALAAYLRHYAMFEWVGLLEESVFGDPRQVLAYLSRYTHPSPSPTAG